MGASASTNDSIGRRMLFPVASRGTLRIFTGAGRRNPLMAVVVANVERCSMAIGIERGSLARGHSAHAFFGHRFRLLHGHIDFLVVVIVFSTRLPRSTAPASREVMLATTHELIRHPLVSR